MKKIICLFFLCLCFSFLQAQTSWKDQIIFKNLQYQKRGNDRGYVLLYAQEHKKLIALDAETGERLETQFILKDEELFLPVERDKYLQQNVVFLGQKNKDRWEITIYHFASKSLQPTGPSFVLSDQCIRILEMVYQNGYLYYLYEENNGEENKLLLERKNIQCTNVGLPTFSNESSELFYDSQIDDFLVERKFAVLPDGLEKSQDIVLLITKGTKAAEKITARNNHCEVVEAHCIKELPDKSVSFAPPAGTNFSTIIVYGSIQNEYDLYLIGNKNEQTYIYHRSKKGNEEEEDVEIDTIPVSGGLLYTTPFSVRGDWWFPIQHKEGVNMFYYTETEGKMQFSSNYIDTYPLYLMKDPKDAHFMYGFSPNTWQKYALGRSLSDWEDYGGFRTLESGKKTLCPLPNKSAVNKKIHGTPYAYGLSPIETLEIIGNTNLKNTYYYLNTKESSNTFAVTRKYCLQYNPAYSNRRRSKTSQKYEFDLIWEAAYGSDTSIRGFYIPYQGKNTLLVNAVNRLHKVACEPSLAEERIQSFSFSSIEVPDGIESLEWYKKDLKNIVQMVSLGQWNGKSLYFIQTPKNIYQALVDDSAKCTLIPATNVTSPIQNITFCSLSEDNSTVILGGINSLQRAFIATLDLIAGKETPYFIGTTYSYVQDLQEQLIRKPSKILQRGDSYYVLTQNNQVEIYEKANSRFIFAGNLQLPEGKVLDIALVEPVLWVLGENKIYSLDLRNRVLGNSVQTHFNQNHVDWNVIFPDKPIKLSSVNNVLFLHFPKQLDCFSGSVELGIHHKILLASDYKVDMGYQIQASREMFYIAANKQLYCVSKNDLSKVGMLATWKTVSPDICQLFLSKDAKELYYLSQDGEVGAIETGER